MIVTGGVSGTLPTPWVPAPEDAGRQPSAGVPAAARHRVRASRDLGRRTRTALLDEATRLFAGRGLARVSLADIATAANAFPSQVTYYFGSKEALFVEAACRDVLRLAARVERAGSEARTREEYARVLAREALSSPALLVFAEALLLARQRAELEPLVARTMGRLHDEGARAVTARCQDAGWRLWSPADAVARGFWAVVIGLVLTRAASGGGFDDGAAEAAVLATLSVEPPGSSSSSSSSRSSSAHHPRRRSTSP